MSPAPLCKEAASPSSSRKSSELLVRADRDRFVSHLNGGRLLLLLLLQMLDHAAPDVEPGDHRHPSLGAAARFSLNRVL